MKLVALFNKDGSPQSSCPVNNLRLYLNQTSQCRSNNLFVNPVTFIPCNKGRIVFYIRKLIRISQPDAYARFHDLRKLSSWKAFWSKMSWSSIRARGFWKTNFALSKHYLRGSLPSDRQCMALGMWSL